MKSRYIKTGACIRFVAAPLMIAGMFLNSVCAVAEGPIPFNAMMQSSSAQAALPPNPAAQGVVGQPANTGHVTNGGKAEIIGGFALVGVGVTTIAITGLLNGGNGMKPSGAKSPALYAGGAGIAAVGVTLVAFGFHKHSAK